MIIVVSDVHLGYEGHCNYKEFNDFLIKCNESDIEHLVLLGDILDFWRTKHTKLIMDPKYAEVYETLGNLKAKNVHYVTGNHDYCMMDIRARCDKAPGQTAYPFEISRTLRLSDGGSKFYFFHGYELEALLSPVFRGDIGRYERVSEHMCSSHSKTISEAESGIWDIKEDIARYVDRLQNDIEKLEKPPQDRDYINEADKLASSKGLYLLLGMMPDDKLVYGHT